MIRKNTVLLLVALFALLSGYSSFAAEKVVVIPLQSGKASFNGNLYHTIPFAQFTPGDEASVDYQHGWLFASLGYLVLEGGSLGTFNAPVILPDNAIVSQISLSASDDSDSATITVWFEKVALDSTTIDFIPDNTGVDSSSLTTDETGIISTAVNNEVIDNENFYYFIYALFSGSPSDRLKAVRIEYQLP